MLSIFISLATSALIQQHEEKRFLSWMRSTNQLYTGDEYQLRLGIFLTNARLVREHKHSSFTMELNKFAAMTPSEYKALLGFRQINSNKKATLSTTKAPEAVDWREKGAVTEVQDQGQCGSCWAFSTIGSAEGSWFIAGNKLTKFSEQNLVDCVILCYGCDGGNMDLALDYVIEHQYGKYMLDSIYPYEAIQRACRFDKTKAVGHCSKYTKIVKNNEDDLAAKVSENGPASIGIDAGCASFQLYHGGIYDDKECSPIYLNHGVTCVGFGVEGEKGYWIVKNSWGSSWGEKGYIRFLKGNNTCGVATDALVAIA